MKELNTKAADQIEYVSYAEGFRRYLFYGYSREDMDPLSFIMEAGSSAWYTKNTVLYSDSVSLSQSPV